jgi:hypothetical protein
MLWSAAVVLIGLLVIWPVVVGHGWLRALSLSIECLLQAFGCGCSQLP